MRTTITFESYLSTEYLPLNLKIIFKKTNNLSVPKKRIIQLTNANNFCPNINTPLMLMIHSTYSVDFASIIQIVSVNFDGWTYTREFVEPVAVG